VIAKITARAQPAAVDQPLEGFQELKRLQRVEPQPMRIGAHPASKDFAAWYLATVTCPHGPATTPIRKKLLAETKSTVQQTTFPCKDCLLWATEAVATLVKTRQQERPRARQSAPEAKKKSPVEFRRTSRNKSRVK
jgi:hypothetical protein